MNKNTENWQCEMLLLEIGSNPTFGPKIQINIFWCSHFLLLSKQSENFNFQKFEQKTRSIFHYTIIIKKDLIFRRAKYCNSRSIDLFIITSHCSTSSQESPSTPSVLQTAYAKGSTVSSVISEPILSHSSPLIEIQPVLH